MPGVSLRVTGMLGACSIFVEMSGWVETFTFLYFINVQDPLNLPFLFFSLIDSNNYEQSK